MGASEEQEESRDIVRSVNENRMNGYLRYRCAYVTAKKSVLATRWLRLTVLRSAELVWMTKVWTKVTQ